MGRIERIHRSRWMISYTHDGVRHEEGLAAYAELDVLGTVDQGGCALQHTRGDGLAVSESTFSQQGR